MKRVPLAIIVLVTLGLTACDRGQNETIAAERDELRQQVSVLQERQQALEAEREQITAERQELQALTATLQEQLDNMQSETQRLQEERAELQSQLENNLGSQLQLVEVELEQARATVEILERRRDTLRERVGTPTGMEQAGESSPERVESATTENGETGVQPEVQPGAEPADGTTNGTMDETTDARASIQSLTTAATGRDGQATATGTGTDAGTDTDASAQEAIRVLAETARQRGLERGLPTAP